MPSITSWTRLEPRARSEAMITSLQARIHDPLWLLARQWQFGEFQGEDTGSPIRAQLERVHSQIERYFPGYPDSASLTSSKNKPYDSKLPLETWVERERIREEGNYRLAAEAGLHFLRLLSDVALAAKYHTAFLKTYALKLRSENDPRHLDSDSLRFLSVMAGRALDGVLLRSKFTRIRQVGEEAVLPNEAPFSAIAQSDRPSVIKATTDWLDWYDTLFSESQNDSAWVPERMEYEFAVSVPMTVSPTLPPIGLVLTMPEYSEGHLDWYSFAVDPNSSLGMVGQPTESLVRIVIPTPVHFRGMPATRWWEFEDAGVNFGGVEAAPEDLVRLLLTEFTLIYGNDFFFIPIDLPVGSVCHISSLIVTNTFGERIPIPPSSQVDGLGRRWRMFCLSVDHRSGATTEPLDFFFLPPVLGASLEGSPVEEVLLLRDEMANMAWAVERIIESPAGQLLNRFEAYQEERRHKEAEQEKASPGSTAPRGGPLAYRLATSVPDYWIPLVPVQMPQGSRRAIGLERRASTAPRGRIMEPDRLQLVLNEEEVPRAGARVTRAYQYARWIDGSTHLWIGKQKQPGRGEGSSGLRFDIIEPV